MDIYPVIFEIDQEKTVILYKQILLQLMKKYIVQKLIFVPLANRMRYFVII